MALMFRADSKVRVVTRKELTPEYLRDARGFTAAREIAPHKWPDTMLNWVIQTDTQFANTRGEPVELPFAIFYPTDADIETGRFETVERRIAEWFETIICRPVPAHVTPRLRREGALRMLVVASYVRARFPCHEMMFGVRAANDNSPPIPENAGIPVQ